MYLICGEALFDFFSLEPGPRSGEHERGKAHARASLRATCRSAHQVIALIAR